MLMTEAQRLTLKEFIQADPVLGPKATAGDYEGVANGLNAFASPDYWVWRTIVTKSELTNSTSQDATTFTWTGNGFITRSAGEQAAWRELFNGSNAVNPTLANVRQAFSDIFSGAGNAAANRTHLLSVARRKATLAEKALASGTGSTASPASLGVYNAATSQYAEGAIGAGDVGGILS